MNEFYVTLPSNASMDVHPDNTKSNYITELMGSIKFDYPYEVGLVEISNPCNIDFEEQYYFGKIEIYRSANDNNNYDILLFTDKLKESGNLFEYIKSSLTIAKTALKLNESFNMTKVISSTDSTRYSIKFELPQNFEMVFNGEIANMIGIPEKIRKSSIFQTKNVNDANIKEYFTLMKSEHLFVYSDIADFQYVGDTKAQLLRVVHIDKNSMQAGSQSKYYPSPHYIPVTRNNINNIQITIKNKSNELVRFKDGSELVIVKLHFRPQKYVY
jgi:hypothetical protein